MSVYLSINLYFFIFGHSCGNTFFFKKVLLFAVEHLVQAGKQVLEEQGGNTKDIR
jgi:hypothetical protein